MGGPPVQWERPCCQSPAAAGVRRLHGTEGRGAAGSAAGRGPYGGHTQTAGGPGQQQHSVGVKYNTGTNKDKRSHIVLE